MHAHITAFEVNLRLWEAQLANGRRVRALSSPCCLHVYPMTWSRTLALVSSPLWGRNLSPVSQESGRWLWTSSYLPDFDFPVGDAPAPLQMELVEPQCNDKPKAKFYNSSPLSFFSDIALPSSNCRKYIAHVQRIVAMFGGTCCEQLFS